MTMVYRCPINAGVVRPKRGASKGRGYQGGKTELSGRDYIELLGRGGFRGENNLA